MIDVSRVGRSIEPARELRAARSPLRACSQVTEEHEGVRASVADSRSTRRSSSKNCTLASRPLVRCARTLSRLTAVCGSDLLALSREQALWRLQICSATRAAETPTSRWRLLALEHANARGRAREPPARPLARRPHQPVAPLRCEDNRDAPPRIRVLWMMSRANSSQTVFKWL
jgi:hypothetical protein